MFIVWMMSGDIYFIYLFSIENKGLFIGVTAGSARDCKTMEFIGNVCIEQ